MTARFAVAHGTPGGAVPCGSEADEASWMLDWTSDRRNAVCDVSALRALARQPYPALLADLVDIATAVYLADIAAVRGRCEEWVRDIELEIPVRDVFFWRSVSSGLCHLLYTLTHDNIAIRFCEHTGSDAPPPASAGGGPEVDCVCLLSGGLDSLAGGAMLLHAGRRPLFLSHQSGNATVETAQRQAFAALDRLAPGSGRHLGVRMAPGGHGPEAYPYPPPERRENSRRARSFLFMTLATVAAHAVGVSEVYLCENGILTAALPLTPARSGSLSTRSTHPAVLQLYGDILEAADLSCDVINPFLYQTKGEVIRTFLKPLLPPADIHSTVSCWAAGRQNRQCGGCIPCLLRRISLLSAGMQDEAYMMDLLATPAEHRGTDAFGNLVDLLTQAATFLSRTDFDLLLEFPQLLDLEDAGVSVADTVKTFKRHAGEVYQVVQEHFPAAATLMGGMGA